jgi:hydroxypyruvate isomerase
MSAKHPHHSPEPTRTLSIHLGHMIPIVSDLGFREVEFPFPYRTPAAEYAAMLKRNGLRQNVLIAPSANYNIGEPGYAIHPHLKGTFRETVPLALEYASAIGARLVHVMSGCLTEGQGTDEAWDTFVENVEWASQEAKAAGRKVVIEPINSKDFPRYFLNSPALARAVCNAVALDIGIIYDVYHSTIMEEDPVEFCRTSAQFIDHLQLADAPGRHEPGTGGISFGELFQTLENVNYQGTLGLEYKLSMPLAQSVVTSLVSIGPGLETLLNISLPSGRYPD